jgi:hypothetical protein
MSSFIEELIDENETLSDADREALAAEEAGVSYEPEPEAPPEMVEKNHELESELAAEQERNWRLDERRRISQEIEAATATRREEPRELPTRLGPRPDPELDPWGSDIWDARRETELVRMGLEEQQRSAEQREFSNWVNSDVTQFRADHPDYDAATAHAYSFRVEYWKGLGLDDARARQIVDQERSLLPCWRDRTARALRRDFTSWPGKSGTALSNRPPGVPRFVSVKRPHGESPRRARRSMWTNSARLNLKAR